MVSMRTPRHDPVEIRRLLELRQTESLTYQQLSERSGVPVHVLTYRATQDRQASREETPPPTHAGFVEVVDGTMPASESALEVVGPRGHRVVVNSMVDIVLLEHVLRALPC
jgi:hypothetical protein